MSLGYTCATSLPPSPLWMLRLDDVCKPSHGDELDMARGIATEVSHIEVLVDFVPATIAGTWLLISRRNVKIAPCFPDTYNMSTIILRVLNHVKQVDEHLFHKPYRQGYVCHCSSWIWNTLRLQAVPTVTIGPKHRHGNCDQCSCNMGYRRQLVRCCPHDCHYRFLLSAQET